VGTSAAEGGGDGERFLRGVTWTCPGEDCERRSGATDDAVSGRGGGGGGGGGGGERCEAFKGAGEDSFFFFFPFCAAGRLASVNSLDSFSATILL
jgi:hypothetical protein